MWSLRTAMPRRSVWRVAQFDTLRLRLIKLAARVEVLRRKVRLHLPLSMPNQPVFTCADGVRQHRRRRTRAVGPGQAPRTLWTYPPPRQDAPRRLLPKEATRCASSANGWDRLRLPRPDPCLGTVAERQ